MGKATISIPLITLRPDGAGGYRPRYIPGKKHRRLGLKGEDLRHPGGAWFTLDECAAWSTAQLQRVAELEAAAPRKRKALTGGGITVAELFARWFETPRMKGERVVEGKKARDPLSDNTVDFYTSTSRVLERFDDGRIWTSPAAAITPAMLAHPERGILHRIEVESGLYVVRQVRATASSCWGWGKGKGLVPSNPWRGLDVDLPVPAPRIRVGSIAEMQHLLRAADLLVSYHAQSGEPVRRYHDIGDAIVLGLWTGQRQADRLALVDGQETPDGFLFRQQKKHGQPLLIPPSPELRDRLLALRARRADWRVNYPNIVLNEEARAPFLRHWYSHCFARVRDAACRGLVLDAVRPDGSKTWRVPAEAERVPDGAEWLLQPMPSLEDFRDQDLRDTAVTWLALAGNDKIRIASITGHSLKTIDEILKHYLGLHPDLARSAIGALVAWYDAQQGETNG